MRFFVAAAALLSALLLFAMPVAGQDPYEKRMWEIAAELACPVCQGQSVKDSKAQLALQIQALIVEKLKAGESPEAIKQFLVARYGEDILMSPPKRGLQLGVWLAPPLFLIAGALLVVAKLRSKPPAPPAGTTSSEMDNKLERELARWRDTP